MRLPSVRRIAVLRANGIGDFVFALPALAALRAAYPGAEVVLLGSPWHVDILAARRAPLDRVEVVPPLCGVSRSDRYEATPAERSAVEAFCQRMRAERFDLAVQMHGGGRFSNPFILSLGAATTAGFRTPDAAPLDLSLPYRHYQNEVMRFLELANAVGAPPTMLEPRMAVTERDRMEADALLAALGYRPAARLALLAPGAGDARRRWPASSFAAVARALAEAGAFVVIIGSEADIPLGNYIRDASCGAAVLAAGRLSLCGLLGLLARASVAVCNDTGPLHLAVAVGAPTVGIFWAGNLVNAGPLTRTRHRAVISWRLCCPVCGMDCISGRCEDQASFVAEASVEEVLSEARDLMQ